MPETARVMTFINNMKNEIGRHVSSKDPTNVQSAIIASKKYDGFHDNPFHLNPNLSRQKSGPIGRRFSSTSGTSNNPIHLDNVETNADEQQIDEFTPAKLVSDQYKNDKSCLEAHHLLLAQLIPEQIKLFKEKRCFYCKKVGLRRAECRKAKIDRKNFI